MTMRSVAAMAMWMAVCGTALAIFAKPGWRSEETTERAEAILAILVGTTVAGG